MKKLIYLCSIVFFFVTALSGQSSSVWQDSVVYSTPEDQLFLLDKETKFLFKGGNYTNSSSLEDEVGFEFKVYKPFSISYILGPDLLEGDLGHAIEGRYYFQMAKRIKAGKQANNLSGKYLSATYGKSNLFFREDTIGIGTTDLQGYTFAIGEQKRVLDDWYIDYGLELDFVNSTLKNGLPHYSAITLRAKSSLGYVFGKKQNLDMEAICPIMKCYIDRRSAFKIHRNDLFSLSRRIYNSQDARWRLTLNPRIGHEIKIANSAFTIEQDLQANIVFSDFINIDGSEQEDSISYTYKLGARYYYKMRRKILEGNSGNNLTGVYAFARAEHTATNRENQGVFVLGVGRQREITGSVFMDTNVGLGFNTYGDPLGPDVFLIIDLTVGYLF